MEFDASYSDIRSRGLPTKERDFSGAIPQQIRQIRTFFRESSFFKTYQLRKPEGGFREDPEIPTVAVDEAVVNAVAHRDYGTNLPIECCHYRDGFTVENPGRVLQRGRDVPSEFSLENEYLDSMPRNSKIIEWLRSIRDQDGAVFVRALSEGTKVMKAEMLKLQLPAPLFSITNGGNTVVTLISNAPEREARNRAAAVVESSQQHTNLFRLEFSPPKAEPTNSSSFRHKDVLILLRDSLEAKGWFVDSLKFGILLGHHKNLQIPVPPQVAEFVRLYPAYAMQVRSHWGRHYLCIDYTLEVKNILNVQILLPLLTSADLIGRSAIARLDAWRRGKILSVNEEFVRLWLYELDREESVRSDQVIPDLPSTLIGRILSKKVSSFDLQREIKRHSLALEPASARVRSEKIVLAAQELAGKVFPLQLGPARISLSSAPEPLITTETEGTLFVRSIGEPTARFAHDEQSANIRDGITTFGSYGDKPRKITLIPVCTEKFRKQMVDLIDRLKVGKYKYRGAERTFKVRFDYPGIAASASSAALIEECQRLLIEHPEWIGSKSLDRIFLVHTPEEGYSSDDENAPYYRIKRLLLEQGIPNQMVDTPTLENPDWKDLNLSLNIVAKCGVTPWVLTGGIPEADFFIGLSYTQSRIKGRDRLVGYAMVFNRFGNWEFYLGNTDAFSYEQRAEYFATLTKQTLSRLALSETPSVYFHYSAKFSRDDRHSILEAARTVRPKGIYAFVSINVHHHVRLFDQRPETDGTVSRGSYVATGPRQLLLSTTGYNPFRKMLGTPRPVEVTAWIERLGDFQAGQPDLKSLAAQILALTKLNWASTDSVCGEPITTKYAGDIAYLTDAFLRQTGTFRLHPVLETTPWFL